MVASDAIGKIMALLRLELNMPYPGDPDKEARVFYTAYYLFSGRDGKNREWENTDDSPDESRTSLIKKTHTLIDLLPKDSRVLDLGAGRQIFEKEYEDNFGRPKCKIIAVDIANIPKENLLADAYPHIQASGRQLPFSNDSFDAVVSNMAFDFMLPEALPELQRVAKPGASIFLNLHHPSLLKYDIDHELAKVKRKMRFESKFSKRYEKLKLRKTVLSHHRHLRNNGLLFETHDQIAKYFTDGGFNIKSIDIKHDSSNKWWEVDLIKPDSQKVPLAHTGTIFTISR